MEIDNFLIECIRHYNSYDTESFMSEYKRLKSVKKILCKYDRCGEVNERLLLNHIIILYNLFDDFATYMLFKYIEVEHWKYIATILIYLNRVPNRMPFGNKKFTDIGIDAGIVSKLREL